MDQAQDKVTIKNIIVTMIITPAGEGQQAHLDAQTSVSINGKQVENVQAALVLSGDVALGLTSNVETIGHLRELGIGARNLANSLHDRVLDALMDAVSPKPATDNGEPPQQDAPPQE